MIHVTGGTITSNVTLALGDAGKGRGSAWVLQMVVQSGIVSITPAGCVSGAGLTASDASKLAYTDRASGTTYNSNTTPIGASGIFEVRCAGLDLYLNVTANGALLDIYAEPVVLVA